MWNWETVKEAIRSLRGRLGFEDSNELRFIGYKLDLETGEVIDELTGGWAQEGEKRYLYYILYTYSRAEREVEETEEYKSLHELFNPSAAEVAIRHNPMYRAYVKRLEQLIDEEAELVYRAAEPFDHEVVEGLAEAAVKVYALPRIPIIIAAYSGEEGIPASVIVLYDGSIKDYLPDPEAISALTSVVLKRLVTVLEKG